HTIMAMITEGRASNNEALQNAAQILNQFVFASSNFIPPSSLSSDKPNPDKTKEDELNQREMKFRQNKLNSANNDLNTRVNNSYKATIEANIDPKQSMTDYVRKQATREALESLNDLINQDKRFKTIVDKLWQNAADHDFDKVYTDKIKSAFLYKAKTLMPSVIEKARKEALKGMGKHTSTNDESDSPTKKNVNKNNEERPRSKPNSGKSVPRNMSSLEYLMSDD